jgi:hypothetical protein
MISWGVIAYGAVLSAVVAGLVVGAVARGHRLTAGLAAAIGAAAGAASWNAILYATHGQSFFTDAPIPVLPASWQDTGSGVFTIAVTAVLMALSALHDRPARQVVGWSVLAGLAAFVVDVYLY